MFSPSKHAHSGAAVLLAAAVGLGACGSDSDGDDRAAPSGQAQTQARAPSPGPDVSGFTCRDFEQGDVHLVREVQYALADQAEIPNLSRLHAAQSIYFALSEICKRKRASYTPGREAIARVKDGTYRYAPASGTEDPD